MSRFYKDLAGDHFESLAKAIYRKETGQVIDPQELYLPLLVLPRSLVAWCIKNVMPIKINETKSLEVPGSEAKLEIRKIANDIYNGEIIKSGKILNKFENIPLPTVAGTLLNVLELYEEVAGRPVSEIEKAELAEVSKEDKIQEMIDKLGQLVDKIVQLKDVKKEEPQVAQTESKKDPVVVNINLSNIGNLSKPEEPKSMAKDEIVTKDDEQRKKTLSEIKSRILKEKPDLNEVNLLIEALSHLRGMRRKDPLDRPNPGNAVVVRQGLDPQAEGAVTQNIDAVYRRLPATPPQRPAAPGVSDVGQDIRSKNPEAAKDKILSRMQALAQQTVPNLPKAEIKSDEKGVHQPPNVGVGTFFHGKKGTSDAGLSVIHGAGRVPSKNQDHLVPRLQAIANKKLKNTHNQKLQELKAMPRPNLPKAEFPINSISILHHPDHEKAMDVLNTLDDEELDNHSLAYSALYSAGLKDYAGHVKAMTPDVYHDYIINQVAEADLDKAREDQTVKPEYRKEYREFRNQDKSDPLDSASPAAPGTSAEGIEVRRADSKEQGAVVHGYGRIGDPSDHVTRAKKAVRSRLKAVKEQPKADLPKSEEGLPADSYHIKHQGHQITDKPLSLKEIIKQHGPVKELESKGFILHPAKPAAPKMKKDEIDQTKPWTTTPPVSGVGTIEDYKPHKFPRPKASKLAMDRLKHQIRMKARLPVRGTESEEPGPTSRLTGPEAKEKLKDLEIKRKKAGLPSISSPGSNPGNLKTSHIDEKTDPGFKLASNELEKGKEVLAPLKSPKMSAQAPTPPAPGAKGNAKPPTLAGPIDSAAPTKSVARIAPPKAAGPKLQPKALEPKSAIKMKAMKSVMSVSKEEVETAKSDSGKKMFKKDEKGNYIFNPTGSNAVMTKDSLIVKKNEQGFEVVVDPTEWDDDNVMLLKAILKAKHLLKKYGY